VVNYICKACNQSITWVKKRNMIRLGPTQIVIREKLEIRMQNGPFQSHKNGKHQKHVKRENSLYYYPVINFCKFFSGIRCNMWFTTWCALGQCVIA
jgi:hypothetical protein